MQYRAISSPRRSKNGPTRRKNDICLAAPRGLVNTLEMLRGFAPQTPCAPNAPTIAAQQAPNKTSLQSRRAPQDNASLASLFLATKQPQPLQVPPHAVMTPFEAPKNHFFSHLMGATRVDEHLLRAPTSRAGQQYFVLGQPISSVGQNTIRGMRKIDRELAQIYLVKEIPLTPQDAADLLGPPHSLLAGHGLSPAIERIANEVNNQAAIGHPMTPHFSLVTADTLYLAMPQMGANVFDVLNHVRSERQGQKAASMNMTVRTAMAYKILHGVLHSLSAMHEQGLAHRDIKLENMTLRQDGDVYLIDFDSSLHIDEHAFEGGHTVGFLAPEARGNNAYDPRAADIWALGVSLVVTLLARNPFAASDDPQQLLNQWQAELVAAQAQQPLSQAHMAPTTPGAVLHAALQNAAPQLYSMLLRMLDTRPQMRATAAELVQMLAELAPSQRPDVSPLLQELRGQVQNQDMPVAKAIAQDTRLMQVQPGERATRRPSLRRVNSLDTLVRPFVQPFDSVLPRGAQEHVDQAKAQRDWKASPTFLAVQQFLYDQEEQLLEHLSRHPEAASRLYEDMSP